MRKLTPEEIAELEEVERRQAEIRERWEARLRRSEEHDERRRRFVRRLLRLGLPG